MNAVLRLDPDEARRESPALLEPRPGATLIAVAGGPGSPTRR
jgi:arylformamidase